MILGRIMTRHGLNLQDEMNGQMFVELIESVLKIEIMKAVYTRGRGDGASNATYARVRLLSTMIHNADLKKTVGTSAIHAQTKLKLKSTATNTSSS